MDSKQLAAILDDMPRRPVKVRVQDAIFEIDFVQEPTSDHPGSTDYSAEIVADTFGKRFSRPVAAAELVVG